MGAIDGRLGPAPVLTNRRLDKPRPVANNFATWLAKNCAFRPILVGLRRRFPGSECRSLAKIARRDFWGPRRIWWQVSCSPR